MRCLCFHCGGGRCLRNYLTCNPSFIQAFKMAQDKLRETSPEYKEISPFGRYDKMRFTHKELFSAHFASLRLCVALNYFLYTFRLVRAT